MEFGLPAERIWVSVYEKDAEALAMWRDEIGVPMERIQRLGDKDNFWAAGPTGPCGPCSELYYDFHPERGTEGGRATVEDDSRFIEFHNLVRACSVHSPLRKGLTSACPGRTQVFMESNRSADGTLTPLANKNIDTGMGLERMAQILQGVPNNYETDLIMPIVQRAAEVRTLVHSPAHAGGALTRLLSHSWRTSTT